MRNLGMIYFKGTYAAGNGNADEKLHAYLRTLAERMEGVYIGIDTMQDLAWVECFFPIRRRRPGFEIVSVFKSEDDIARFRRNTPDKMLRLQALSSRILAPAKTDFLKAKQLRNEWIVKHTDETAVICAEQSNRLIENLRRFCLFHKKKWIHVHLFDTAFSAGQNEALRKVK